MSHLVTQARSPFHCLAVALYGLAIASGLFAPQAPLAILIVFFLVTALPLLWRMILLGIVVAVVLAVLPFLAPVAIIVMIIIFFARLGYIVEHWRPVVAGVVVYGFGALMVAWGMSPPALLGIGGQGPLLFLVLAAIGVGLMHGLMLWQYANGYTATTALGIMGAVPLTLALVVLPFLKLFSGHAGDVGHAPADSLHDAGGYHGAEPAPPGYTHVDAYLRTNPDGIVENNLSYNGPHPATPGGGPATHVVGPHLRSLPDGIVENNLSYSPATGAAGVVPAASGAASGAADALAGVAVGASLAGSGTGDPERTARQTPGVLPARAGYRPVRRGLPPGYWMWVVASPIACWALIVLLGLGLAAAARSAAPGLAPGPQRALAEDTTPAESDTGDPAAASPVPDEAEPDPQDDSPDSQTAADPDDSLQPDRKAPGVAGLDPSDDGAAGAEHAPAADKSIPGAPHAAPDAAASAEQTTSPAAARAGKAGATQEQAVAKVARRFLTDSGAYKRQDVDDASEQRAITSGDWGLVVLKMPDARSVSVLLKKSKRDGWSGEMCGPPFPDEALRAVPDDLRTAME
jgi:hypothetical protein